MERGDRKNLRSHLAELQAWATTARQISDGRTSIQQKADEEFRAIMRSAVRLARNGTTAWHVIPLADSDGHRLASVARKSALPEVTFQEQDMLNTLVRSVGPALEQAPTALSGRRFFVGSKKRVQAENSADYLNQYVNWATSAEVPPLLQRLRDHIDVTPQSLPASDALSASVGLDARLASLGSPRELVPVAELADVPMAVKAIGEASRWEKSCRKDAIDAATALQRKDVEALLATMPVDAIRDSSEGKIRVNALTAAGIRTVGALLARGHQLENLPGIGAVTAKRMRGAAQALKQAAQEETPIRLDLDQRTPEATTLLRRLAAWDLARKNQPSAADAGLAESLAPLSQAIRSDTRYLILISGSRPLQELADMVDRLAEAAEGLDTPSVSGAVNPWDDFQARPADYYAMLGELGFMGEDEQSSVGDLPDDVIDAIRRFDLNTEHLSVSLRGYQSFGARFALVQRKVIIGDEMGLGKTVEALAVLAHLRSQTHTHFLVVCPAAVVTNWMREVASKSRLQPHRIHGADREGAAREWRQRGGVGITTFETLAWLMPHLTDHPEISGVVVDEAHYIKNPSAKRSQRCARLIRKSHWAVLLTGTPMENRIGEFRDLVRYLRPDLVVDGDELRPRRFRAQVAPAYLRRNQEDVLSELPELVEIDEFLPMSSGDEAAYAQAVSERHWMRMRQAAMLTGHESEKLKRLLEIVEEAEASGRRVIVYSFFLSVLDQVARSIPGKVFGPLTGSVPAALRQTMVDDFAKAEHGAVLVAQIQAGGVGLNVQAASVVIICEPQLKPTAEWQAIARAHRMGQLHSVQVHRLVSEEGVDQRIREILARKTELFEDFARVSETAESAPEAFDITDAEIARQVIAAEQERLGITTLEQAG